MLNIKKCAIIGCGNVGATIAYTLLSTGKNLFSEIVLIDINRDRANGEAMDLNHCLPYLSPVSVYAGDYKDLYNAYVVIVAAGANQAQGESRRDLLQRNAEVFESIIQKITHFNRECILLIVTNPVDVLTYTALKISGFVPEHVIGTGCVLDTARLKYLLGERLNVDNRNVHMFIIGEHGESELPVWSGANISGIDLDRYCEIEGTTCSVHDFMGIYEYVWDSAHEIIRGKGATYYGIAQAAHRILSAIVNDENAILPVSVLLNGEYGIHDVCLGVPSVIGNTGVKHILEIPLDANESLRLHQSADMISELTASVDLSRISYRGTDTVFV